MLHKGPSQIRPLSRRAYAFRDEAFSWEEIWEAGPYYERISHLLEKAEKYAVFVGWQIDSRLPLPFPSAEGFASETLREKMIRLCRKKPYFQAYFLMWDHAYLYVFEREPWQGRVWEEIHPNIHFVFDNRHTFGGAHHEKIVMIDGVVALCGGVDLCADRWDSPDHLYFDSRRSLDGKKERYGPYHDLAVQVTGPICGRLQEHVASRWRVLCRTPFPTIQNGITVGGGHTVYLSRTISPVDLSDSSTKITREIEFLFKELIQRAEYRIIVENQYYWSRALHDLLVTKLHEKKGQNFELILVLADLQNTRSLTRHMASYQLDLLQQLKAAATSSGTKLTLASPFVVPPKNANSPVSISDGIPKPVYIHSKILLIDDSYLSIGSANFAARALRVDTEVQLTLEAHSVSERAHIQKVAADILNHWSILSSDSNNLDETASSLVLREIQPALDSRHLQKKLLKKKSWVQHGFFYDPVLPWFYLLKSKYRKWIKWADPLFILHMGLIWVAVLVGFVGIKGIYSFQNFSSEIPYLLLLSAVWLFPVPFLPVAFLAELEWGPSGAMHIILASFWAASLLSYGLGRVFPARFALFFKIDLARLRDIFSEERSFEGFLRVILDPKATIHEKILYPGLNFIPLPWFLLGIGVILPGIFYAVLHWIFPGIQTLLPEGVKVGLRGHTGFILGGIFFLSFVRLIREKWPRK